MLSIQKCRQLLGGAPLSDTEVETLRDALYAFAEVAINAYSEGQRDFSISACVGEDSNVREVCPTVKQ